ETHPALEPQANRNLGPSSPLWSLFMGFEHEKIHFETSSVLIRELPVELVETPKYWAAMHPTATKKTPSKPSLEVDYPANNWISYEGGAVTYGKKDSAPSFGWDNEYGSRKRNIKNFQVTENLISNGEFYEFVASGSYIDDQYWSPEGLQWRKFRNTKRPTFWVAHGPEGLHDYKLRTLFEIIDMPWSWPVEVNFHEAQAYARWKNSKDQNSLHYRLITEAEHVRLRGTAGNDPVLQTTSYSELKESLRTYPYNFNFQYSSPGPVTSFKAHAKEPADLFGNVWQWAEDQFNPLDDFKVHPLYDDFSTPCFDGKHQMILGGSFISCGHEASKWARFHFRPHFFQHAGFRLAATLDGSTDNESTKLVKSTTYSHPKRLLAQNQMEKADWWKNIHQPLEVEQEELKSLWQDTQDFILEFEKQRDTSSPMGSALDPHSNDVAKNFSVPYQIVKTFPERPENYRKLLSTIFNELAPLGQQPGNPGYMAYVAGAGNPLSNMAQALAQTLNPFTGHFSLAPGLVTIELEALRWVSTMIGYPEKTSGGFFITGGSLATLSALSAAKRNKLKGYDLSKARFYASKQSHHCVGKSLSILGFPQESLVLMPTDQKNRFDLTGLHQQISKDKENGLQPLCVIGTAGSTNTGAVDDLNGLADIAEQNNLWFHVDAAYGGFFLLTEKGKALLKGIERSDSVVLDPHKSLSLPYGTGCLLVRNKSHLIYDYNALATYMPPSPGIQSEDDYKIDFADISPELSRDFRGLRFWLPIKTLGIGPFQVNLEEKLKLSQFLAEALKYIPGIEVLGEPQLSIVNFKWGSSDKTRNLLAEINKSHAIFLSGCTVNQEFSIRVCLLGFRTHLKEVEKLIEIIAASVTKLED
ncbi:MAG TPA: 5-histidylcysteine sulfoxide synthase, partial [Bdellovibrio sp.]